MAYLDADEHKALGELYYSKYLNICIENYTNSLETGQIEVPEDVFEIDRKKNPKLRGEGMLAVSNAIIDKDTLKSGIEMYKKIQEIFIYDYE